MLSRSLAALNRRRNDPNSNEKGFTLIELLVVVIIIGILAAIAIPVYLGIQNNAKDSAVQSDIANAKTAVVASSTSNNGTMPADLTGLSSYGYTAQAIGTNYTLAGDRPAATFSANTFCIQAKSVSGKTFRASDVSGVAAGTCTGAAVTP